MCLMTPEPYRNGKIKSHEIVRVQNVIVVYILVISIKPKVAKGNCVSVEFVKDAYPLCFCFCANSVSLGLQHRIFR